MGKLRLIIINFLVLIFLFPIFDLIASNFFLKVDGFACHKIDKFYYELKKNCDGNYQFKSSFPFNKVYTDAYGLRVGKNRGKEKIRSNSILLFGDSQTFGVGLDYESTVAGILNKKFKNNVHNFGMGSYSPSVYLYKLQKALKDGFEPNKIIVILDLSDVIDEGSRWIKYKDKKPQLKDDFLYNLNQHKKSNKKFIHKNFQVSRYLASLLNSNMRVIRSKLQKKFNPQDPEKVKVSIQGSFTYNRNIFSQSEFWTKEIFDLGIGKIKKKVNEISLLAKKNDFEFYLVIFPWGETLQYGQDAFNWEKFGNEICYKNCKLINSFDKFYKKKEKDIYWYSNLYFIGDEHLNEKGNKFLAKIIENSL